MVYSVIVAAAVGDTLADLEWEEPEWVNITQTRHSEKNLFTVASRACKLGVGVLAVESVVRI